MFDVDLGLGLSHTRHNLSNSSVQCFIQPAKNGTKFVTIHA